MLNNHYRSAFIQSFVKTAAGAISNTSPKIISGIPKIQPANSALKNTTIKIAPSGFKGPSVTPKGPPGTPLKAPGAPTINKGPKVSKF